MIDIKGYLKEYDGPPLALMEVCGTHTAEISHHGITSMLSPKIRLVSGPGCPVCVTVTAYIDRLVELSLKPDHTVVSFGDMLRVKGKHQNLNDARAAGGHVQMVYSPMDTLQLAEAHPERTFVFAAVGFETTVPIYALLLEEAARKQINNVRLLTSLKMMPQVIDMVCRDIGGVDGFLAPGHVSVITGSELFAPLSERYRLPFAVAGFRGEELLAAIYALVRRQGRAGVMNLYPSAVTEKGNQAALQLIDKYFVPYDAAWRGLGLVPGSGLRLREQYACYDAGSADLVEDNVINKNCRCPQVLTGQLSPSQCSLFGRACTPQSPQGACMVSTEGSCYHYYVNRRQ